MSGEPAGLERDALVAIDDGVAVIVDLHHEIVILAQFDSAKHPPPHRAEVDFESRTAIGDRGDRARTDRIALGFVRYLRRQIFWREFVFHDGRGARPGRARRECCFPDGVDLTPGQGQVIIVGPAHQRRHLAPPAVGEVSDLVGPAQQPQEPGRRAATQGSVGLLVQGHDRVRVHRARRHDRANGPLGVGRFLLRHGVERERWPALEIVAVHDRDIHEAHRLVGAPHDVGRPRTRHLRRLVRSNLGAVDHLLEIVDEGAHEQRVRRHRRRRRADPRRRAEVVATLPPQRDFDQAVAGVVEIAAADRLVVVEPGRGGWFDRKQ